MKKYVKIAGIALTFISMVTACSKNDGGETMESESYNTAFKMTDAPIDNANVEAVYVTIADVKIGGTSLEGFSKTTVNLSALVNGQTQNLGNLDMEAGSYSNIVVELDYNTDATGNSPGCYVETADGAKDKIAASANSITVSDAFEVYAMATNEIILDFDLRKTIKEEQGTVSSDFEFVSMSELSAGIRAVNKDVTGMIEGTVSDVDQTSDKIVVYAYEKGTFDQEIETSGKGESNVTFSNAVTSSEVQENNGSYSLNFLKEGEYELVFVSYSKEGDSFSFSALLEAESTTGLNLGAINVTSAIRISANVTITGTK